MRFLKVLIPSLLVISLFANGFMYLRWRRTRPVMTINGQQVSEKDVIDYLQQQRGPIVKKEMTERILIDQQAKKYNMVPSQADIDEEFKTRKELQPQFAQQLAVAPWLEGEAKGRIRIDLEQLRLRAKDVPLTDDDLKEEYNQHPDNYNTPDKAHVNLALVKDLSHLAEIKQFLEKGIAPNEIVRNFSGAVVFPGDNYIYTFVRAFGSSTNAQVFNLKPNEVKQMAVSQAEQQQGVQGIIVRMVDIVPGHKFDGNDPRIKEKIRLTLASKRMKPLQEWLSGVWAETDFTSEQPGDKQYIEQLMFPERGRH